MQPNIINTIHRYRPRIDSGEVITITLRDAVITLQPGVGSPPVDVFVEISDEHIDMDRNTFMESEDASSP